MDLGASDYLFYDAVETMADSLGEFEQIVLLAIAQLDADAYGMTIRRRIEERTERRVAIGALYTALERLERKGYVASALSDPTPQRGGRAKRIFRLQRGGVAALQRSRQTLARMWAGVSLELKPERR
jgi:DNA-binding PadR family transcriptional regulator